MGQGNRLPPDKRAMGPRESKVAGIYDKARVLWEKCRYRRFVAMVISSDLIYNST
jgi:hypothetical protein